MLIDGPVTAHGEVVIREFQPGDAAALRRLNEEWITAYFRLEPKDLETLAHPEDTILAKGGRIFIALQEGIALGTCALIPIAPTEYELAKMGVTASARGLGIGHKLMQAVIAAARHSGATRLYLETNHALTPALRVYTAAGFTPVPAHRLTPSPYQRADIFLELAI